MTCTASRLRLLLLLHIPILLAWPLTSSASSYGVGDYVPVARQAQFHNLRTHWHDLIGRHCPRFGIDREVVLPIPRPLGFSFNEDSYKLKLSFGRERFVTGWLLIMNKGTGFTPPVVNIELTHFAGEFRGVKAKILNIPKKYLEQHQRLVMEWSNETHWPKHIILEYRWKEHAEVDVTAGLVLLFGTSFALATMLALFILQSSKEKLTRFVNEQLADPSPMPTGAIAGDVPKVD